LPSELAERRPDIREAEARLHEATADIGIAVADFYPRITLSGSLDIQALQTSGLGSWNSCQYAFGPSISLPLLEGGRLRGTLELRKAEQKEAAID
jgi:outer membrane protein TolC